EQDVHLTGGVALRRQDLRVDVHVLDVERDVLLGLPLDGVVELLLRHPRQRDLLDDDRVAADADRDLLRLHLPLGEEVLDGLDDRGGVHQGSVHDRLWRQLGRREALQGVAALLLAELHELHARGADVQADGELALRHGALPPLPASGAVTEDAVLVGRCEAEREDDLALRVNPADAAGLDARERERRDPGLARELGLGEEQLLAQRADVVRDAIRGAIGPRRRRPLDRAWSSHARPRYAINRGSIKKANRPRYRRLWDSVR